MVDVLCDVLIPFHRKSYRGGDWFASQSDDSG